jgi:AcrR family transcriptional regulator
MPKQVDAAAQRGEIRAAARRVFAQRGVEGTGLAHVAREAAMGRSSLYHYYPDKDALLTDLMRETLAGELALYRACLEAEGPVLARLDRLVDQTVVLFDAWAAMGRMMLDFRLRDAGLVAGTLAEVRERLAEALREGQRRGEVAAELDPLLTAATLIGAVDGLLLQHFLDGEALDLEALRLELRRLNRRMVSP